MRCLHAIILGVIQGITEFFPISSSAHLIAVRYIFNFGSNLTSKEWMIIDIALHLGTLLAIIIFFFSDFVKMFKEGFKLKLKKKKFKELSIEGKLFWYIIIATIPGAIAGVLFDDVIENMVRDNVIIIACSLIIMGIILYLVDKNSKDKKDIKDITLKEAFLIGIGQAFAIIPGFSRSGTTMTVARIMGLKKEKAAKFSFMLGTPIVLGAAVLELKDITMDMITFPFILGVFISFIVGMIAINTLLKIVKKRGLGVFAIYRIILAIMLIVIYVIRL